MQENVGTPIFVPSESPLVDFACINDPSAKRLSAQVNMKAVGRCTVYYTSSFYAEPLVSGNWVHKQTYCIGGNGHVPALDDTGSYSVCHANDHEIIIRSDMFGLYKIYYYSRGGVSVAANRLHLLLEILRVHNVRLEWDWTFAAPLLNPERLGAQLASFQTPICGVRLVPAGASIRISGESGSLDVITSPKPTAEPRSYEDAIASYAESIRRCVTAVSMAVDFPYLNLSGGRDCRIVLGASLGTRVMKHLRSYGSGEDGRIGRALTRYFGGRQINGVQEKHPICMEDAFNRFRSQNLGTYMFSPG